MRGARRVTDIPAGQVALYPRRIDRDAPASMPGIAVGAYTEIPLASTSSGTSVSVWHLPSHAEEASAGTTNLSAMFDFYERTYGAYAFGTSVGSVDDGADHAGSAQPFWGVRHALLADPRVHAYAAAHGWFGNGVRLGCWEDLTLADGTSSYIAARALAEAAAVDVWPTYCAELAQVCAHDVAALPETCDIFDLHEGTYAGAAPMKGAFFYRAVAGVVGVDALDADLAQFYAAHVSTAAHMQELIDFLVSRASPEQGTTIEALAQAWLRDAHCSDVTALCGP